MSLNVCHLQQGLNMNELMSPCCLCLLLLLLLYMLLLFIYVINDKMTQQITVEVTLLLNAKFHPIIFCTKNVYK